MPRLRVPALVLFTGNLLFSDTPVIKSADGGRRWIDIDPAAPSQGVAHLQLGPDGARLDGLTITDARYGPRSPAVARRDYRVLSSSDGGRTWQELEPLRVTNTWRAAIAIAPADPETLYVAYGRTNKETGDLGREHTILRTTDG